jgi:hypothetical protein
MNKSSQQRFIPSRLVPKFDGYCPLTYVYGYPQPNGRFLARGFDWEKEFEDSVFVDEPGFLVIHLGSVEEDYTVETAANAIFNSVKSLFAGCSTPVDFLRIRTTVELSEYLKKYRSRYSHLIAIGHGTQQGLEFLDRGRPVQGHEMAGLLGADMSHKPLQIISLCCHSGCESMAKGLSKGPSVTEVIAPNREFDMRWAVHFITGYFLEHYLGGRTVDESVRVAAENSGRAPMCVWRDGVLSGSCAPCSVKS